eukprot:1038502-Amorphochlora_amoeboformis.AAC.2
MESFAVPWRCPGDVPDPTSYFINMIQYDRICIYLPFNMTGGRESRESMRLKCRCWYISKHPNM